MSPRTACGDVTNADSDDWRDVTCLKCLAKQPSIVIDFATYCGKEFEANPGSSMREYLDDCANHWGIDLFSELPNDKQLEIRRAFNEGRAIERAARNSP